MAVLHISDLHLGHRNIIHYREGFETVAEHDEFVVDQILTNVSKRDKLFLHGDVCFSKDAMVGLKKITDYLNCALILGNHDLESNARPTIFELHEMFGKNIFSMLSYKGTWLTHAPIHPSELRGKYNLYGHSHGYKVDDTRYYNVCCEQVDYKPILHTKVMEWLVENNKQDLA